MTTPPAHLEPLPCEICRTIISHQTLFVAHRPVSRCPRCSLVSSRARPGSTIRLYGEEYYRGDVYADYLSDRPAIRRNALRALVRIESLTSGRRLLDVGCAAGFFLELARERDWDVFGVEPSEYAAGYARTELGLPIHRGSIQDPMPLEPGFHAITMWDVIEHLDSPSAALGRIRDLLVPGGLLIVSTGDFGSLIARLLGRRWRLLGDPTHQYFFTASTLRRLLDACGFQTVSESRRGKWVSVAMGLHQAPIPFARHVSGWLKRRRVTPMAYVNLGDVMTLTARLR